MLSKVTFSAEDFPSVTNKKILCDAFHYLARIGLVMRREQRQSFELTELGRQILQRASSFYVPHSYHAYMENFYSQLINKNAVQPVVDRVENVIGSGRTHLRYFPFAISFLKRRISFDMIVDVGCGDGGFLSAILKVVLGKAVVGIDSAPIAVQMTRENLRKLHPDREIHMICADAREVSNWGKKLEEIAKQRIMVLSLWFLIHEISQKEPSRVIDFLNQIHDFFPDASLIICEIICHEDQVLARHSRESLMPEYLFFHDLSGQGVLSWADYQQILENIPYEIKLERLFDEVPDRAGNLVPSSFVWCLGPKKNS
ncbi:MAG: methyltransferase domain-containing protein [Candidatus Omnitrophica bacterium]|nr:methyltransferase domain-containing protein [Candidatus Omnitrophota bacterium]